MTVPTPRARTPLHAAPPPAISSAFYDYVPVRVAAAGLEGSLDSVPLLTADTPGPIAATAPPKRHRRLPMVDDWDPSVLDDSGRSAHVEAPAQHPHLPVVQDWQPEPSSFAVPNVHVPHARTLAEVVQAIRAADSSRSAAPSTETSSRPAAHARLPVVQDWEPPHASPPLAPQLQPSAQHQPQPQAPVSGAHDFAQPTTGAMPYGATGEWIGFAPPVPAAMGLAAEQGAPPAWAKASVLRATQVWMHLRKRRRPVQQRWRQAPWSRIAILVGAVIGVGIMLYPSAGTWMSARAQSSSVAGFVTTVQQAPSVEKQAALTAARAYNAKLPHGTLRDPYTAAGSSGANQAVTAQYLKQLTVPGTNVMARLIIPKIHVDLPVYHGTGDRALDRGVGHMLGSSLPVGGASTHAVLAAHSGLPNATMLSDLSKLQLGDTFTIDSMDETLWYRVDQIKVVKPDDLSDLSIADGKDYVTLVTCTPIHINSYRLLVRGVRTAAPPDAVQTIAAPSADFPWWALIFVGAVACIAFVLFAPRTWTERVWPFRRGSDPHRRSRSSPPATPTPIDSSGRPYSAGTGQF